MGSRRRAALEIRRPSAMPRVVMSRERSSSKGWRAGGASLWRAMLAIAGTPKLVNVSTGLFNSRPDKKTPNN